MTIGEILSEARRRRGYDIRTIASQIPCDVAMIRAWESGRNFPRAEEKFRKVVDILRIEIDSILPVYIQEKESRYGKEKASAPVQIKKKPAKLLGLNERCFRRKNPLPPKPGHNWCINCLEYFKFNTGHEFSLWTGSHKDISEFYCVDCWPLLLESIDLYDDTLKVVPRKA